MSWSFGLDFGAGLGALTGAVFSGVSARRQFEYQSALQRQAAQLNYDYSIKSAENMPISTRKGLETAGYNPMLAVQNGTSGANASFTNAGNAVGPDYTGGMSAGLGNVLQIQNMKNQTQQTKSQIDLNEANTRNVVADSISKEIRNKYLDSRERAEIGQIGAQTDKLVRETSYFDALEDNLQKRLELDAQLGFAGLDVQRRGQDKLYNATTYSADKSYDASKYATDNNMIKAGIAGLAGGIGLLYGPAKLKALRLLGKTKAVGF